MDAPLRIEFPEPDGQITEISRVIAHRAAAQRRRAALAQQAAAMRAYCYASDGQVLARYERSAGPPYAGTAELVALGEDWPEAFLIEAWKHRTCLGRLQRAPSGELVEIEAGWPRRLIPLINTARRSLRLW